MTRLSFFAETARLAALCTAAIVCLIASLHPPSSVGWTVIGALAFACLIWLSVLIWRHASSLLRAIGVIALVMALAACATPFKGDAVTMAMAGGGANINSSVGVTVGYFQTDGQFTPVVDSAGKPITLAGCGGRQESISTYSILHGSANANLSSGATNPTGASSSVSATVATSANGPAQAVAVAANRMASVGPAALALALGGGAAPNPAAIHEWMAGCGGVAASLPPTP